MLKKMLLAAIIYCISSKTFSQTLQTVTDNGNVTTKGIRSANPTGDIGVYIYGHPDGTALIQASNFADNLPKNLTINKFGGNVGIGTTTPAYMLDVLGSGNFGSLYVNGSTVWHTGNLTRPVQSYLASDLNTIDGGQGSIIESSIPFPANIPAYTTWFTGINLLANSNPNFVTQFGASVNGRLWTRYKSGGDWAQWSEILTSSNLDLSGKADRSFQQNVDFNTYTSPGLYELDGIMPNAPNNSPNFRVLSMGNSARWTQMAFQWDHDRVFFRRKMDQNFSGWLEFWHSGNFNPSNYFPTSGGNITGNVNIGSSSLQKDLSVNGNIKTRKIKVTQTDWADYVFDSAYQLSSLQAVENFIQQNKHLPDVPSAKEVKANGIDLGDNQVVLLKKIEELTLYIIQQNKQLEEQKLATKEQKEINETLSNRLRTIEEKINNTKK